MNEDFVKTVNTVLRATQRATEKANCQLHITCIKYFDPFDNKGMRVEMEIAIVSDRGK